MTRISIADLQSQDAENSLVDTAISRALNARKISGGTVGGRFPLPTIGLIYVDPKVYEM
jgi:hypothetical protein